MTWTRITLYMAALLVVACSSADAPHAPATPQQIIPHAPSSHSLPTTSVFQAGLWDDGLAEVNTYVATRDRYGRRWEFPLTLITVKEDFDSQAMVKIEGRHSAASTPVIKSHVYYDMPTVNYPYHFAASAFIARREPLRLLKFTSTSSEWCGITHRVLRGWTSPPSLEYRSYFGGENEGVAPLDWPENGFTEEQLLVSLRSLAFRAGLEASVHVLNRQIDSHAGTPTWRPGVLRVGGPEPIMDAGEEPIESWRVDISFADGDTLTYAFSVEAPHILVHHRGPDGITMRLRESRRWAYWDF